VCLPGEHAPAEGNHTLEKFPTYHAQSTEAQKGKGSARPATAPERERPGGSQHPSLFGNAQSFEPLPGAHREQPQILYLQPERLPANLAFGDQHLFLFF
jgi:hypothetical protein